MRTRGVLREWTRAEEAGTKKKGQRILLDDHDRSSALSSSLTRTEKTSRTSATWVHGGHLLSLFASVGPQRRGCPPCTSVLYNELDSDTLRIAKGGTPVV